MSILPASPSVRWLEGVVEPPYRGLKGRGKADAPFGVGLLPSSHLLSGLTGPTKSKLRTCH